MQVNKLAFLMTEILSLTAQKDQKCSFNGPIIKPFAVKAPGLDRKGRRGAASIPYPPTPPTNSCCGTVPDFHYFKCIGEPCLTHS